MTCAGLLGLALGKANADPKDLKKFLDEDRQGGIGIFGHVHQQQGPLAA